MTTATVNAAKHGSPDPLTEVENTLEVSIVMPCLNEAETLATCIQKALHWLQEQNVCGEVIIADNGSSDGSQQIASKMGARRPPKFTYSFQ